MSRYAAITNAILSRTLGFGPGQCVVKREADQQQMGPWLGGFM